MHRQHLLASINAQAAEHGPFKCYIGKNSATTFGSPIHYTDDHEEGEYFYAADGGFQILYKHARPIGVIHAGVDDAIFWSDPDEALTELKTAMNPPPTTTAFRTVLGPNRKIPRSRVWIEGKRLVEAGFTVGARYDRLVVFPSIILTLHPEGKFKVSGKGEKPIIDTAGKVVLNTFPTGTHVEVTFTPGVITIAPITE